MAKVEENTNVKRKAQSEIDEIQPKVQKTEDQVTPDLEAPQKTQLKAKTQVESNGDHSMIAAGDATPIQLDDLADANEKIIDLTQLMKDLQVHVESLTRKPDSFDALHRSIEILVYEANETKKRMEVAKNLLRLDPSKIQSNAQFNISPLFLTEKFVLAKNSTQKNFVSEMNISINKRIRIEQMTIPDVVFNEVHYTDVIVKYEKISDYTGKSKRPHAYVCPFSPVCESWMDSPSNIEDHICSHFNAPRFFCLFCHYASITKDDTVRHFQRCVPYLTDKEEIKKVVSIGKDKELTYADFQVIAKQLWANGHVNLNELKQGLGEKKIDLLSRYFSIAFDLTEMISWNNIFDNLLTELCASSANGNYGKCYAFFETTSGVLSEQKAAKNEKYVGSESPGGKNLKRNQTRHKQFIQDSFRTSNTFHIKVNNAKRSGREFRVVEILTGIRSDKQTQSGKWDRPRHTIEDALKTMFEALSDDLWNINSVSRNEHNETFEWATELRMLFGFFIYRRQWNSIATGLSDRNNIV